MSVGKKLSVLVAALVLAAVCALCATGCDSPSPAYERELTQGIDSLFGINGATYSKQAARESFQAAADEGSADAWFWLGMVRMSDTDGARWSDVMQCFKTAADADSLLGLYGQALLYRSGCGVERNTARALELYKQAADGGCYLADVGLGDMYRFGDGVDIDYARACELYEAAFESSGFLTVNAARVAIGDMYRDGQGVEASPEAALEWYRLASDDGYPVANVRIGELYLHGDIGGSDEAADDGYGEDVDDEGGNEAAPADIKNNDEWAMAYFEKAAAGGAYYNLGYRYLMGDAVEIDPARAMELFQQDIDGGMTASMSMCAMAYLNGAGIGMNRNPDGAIEWARRALEAVGPFDDASDDLQRNPSLYARYILEAYGVE